jgi:hypothetical protein
MSSEANTDPEQTPDDQPADSPGAPARGAVPPDRGALQRIDYAAYARYVVPSVILAIAALAGYFQGPAATLLVLAGGALVAVIATFWASVRTLIGETPLTGADAYALGAPRAEEEQKRAVLRALKDIEFERSVGKISDEDYRVLTTKYRAEAKRLLRLLDAESHPRRAQVEALVAQRLVSAGLAEASPEMFTGWGAAGQKVEAAGGTKAGASGEPVATRRRRKEQRAAALKRGSPAPDAPANLDETLESSTDADANEALEAPAETSAPARVCAACSTVNDADAMFCKRCGKRQEAADDAPVDVKKDSPPDDAKDSPPDSSVGEEAARAEKELA